MIQKTRGIVLQTTDFAESSIIARVYTEAYGMQSYLVNSVRKKKPRFNANIFQPLTLVELVAYHKTGKGLHRLSEITCAPHYTTIPYDFIKSSLALFINELLYKSIKEEEANDTLFNFLFHSFQILDLKTTDCSRFHLILMGQLTRYLGFYPHGEYHISTPVFNLQEGVFQQTRPAHPYYLEGDHARKFDSLMKSGYENPVMVDLSPDEKKQLLHAFILFYELHLVRGTKIKSHHILEEVMRPSLQAV